MPSFLTISPVNSISSILISDWSDGVVIPKTSSYKIQDLANAIGPNCKKEIIGIRSGEKLYEELITSSDSLSTIDIGKYYLILPNDFSVHKKYKEFGKKFKYVPNDFSYNSNENDEFLSIEELRELIRINVDKEFKPI